LASLGIITKAEKTANETNSTTIINNSTNNNNSNTTNATNTTTTTTSNNSLIDELPISNYNLSNDEFYKALAKERNSRTKESGAKTWVLHSQPALKLQYVKTDLNPYDLETWHRPKSHHESRETIQLTPVLPEEEKSSEKKDEIAMKHKKDFSARDGRVVLTEYIEQHPPLLSTVGMGTKVRNYYRKKHPADPTNPKLDDGENVLLEPSEDSPFVGNILSGRTFQSLDNNLYKAPIFSHDVEETDFLLVRTDKKIFIREIPAIYTVGQELPKKAVPGE